jgi:hypothetical protein
MPFVTHLAFKRKLTSVKNPQSECYTGAYSWSLCYAKTELCRFFNAPKGCKFGDKCNFAHGEHELKFKTLTDLEEVGLVDVEVFRCHVCFTFLATGAWWVLQQCIISSCLSHRCLGAQLQMSCILALTPRTAHLNKDAQGYMIHESLASNQHG